MSTNETHPPPWHHWTPSLHPSNPYHYTPEMVHASRLPPKHTDTHVLFFGYEMDTHADPTVGLQQWYPAPFTTRSTSEESSEGSSSSSSNGVTTIEFLTTEHYMMYHKALLMDDPVMAAKILAAPHPSEAKALGRQVRNFDRAKWDANADRIVEEGNWLKFTQNDDLRQILLGTGDKELVEARIWGIGFNSDDALDHRDEWGTNRLGKALMKVRDRLRRVKD